MYKNIQRLEELGLFDILVQKGIIPCTVKNHKNVYQFFLKEKEKGIKTSQAVTNTSIDMRLSESSVYEIMRRMKG